MSLKRIVLSLLVLWFGLMGIACGVVCLLCLIALLLWQGLGVGTAVLALVCLSCLGLAVMLSGRAAKRESERLGGAGPRSLKTWWPSRSRTVSGGVRSPHRDSLDGLVAPPASVGDSSPDRAAEHWAGDLQPYDKWSELPDNIGARRNRKR